MDNTISACQIWHTLLMSLHDANFHLRCQGCQTHRNHNFFIIGSWLQLSNLEWGSLLVENSSMQNLKKYKCVHGNHVCMGGVAHWLFMHAQVYSALDPHRQSTQNKQTSCCTCTRWEETSYSDSKTPKAYEKISFETTPYKTLHNLCSTNVHHYNTKPRRYIVSFIASAMLYLITIV